LRTRCTATSRILEAEIDILLEFLQLFFELMLGEFGLLEPSIDLADLLFEMADSYFGSSRVFRRSIKLRVFICAADPPRWPIAVALSQVQA
jgi:hypothetical protein